MNAEFTDRLPTTVDIGILGPENYVISARIFEFILETFFLDVVYTFDTDCAVGAHVENPIKPYGLCDGPVVGTVALIGAATGFIAPADTELDYLVGLLYLAVARRCLLLEFGRHLPSETAPCRQFRVECFVTR